MNSSAIRISPRFVKMVSVHDTKHEVYGVHWQLPVDRFLLDFLFVRNSSKVFHKNDGRAAFSINQILNYLGVHLYGSI